MTIQRPPRLTFKIIEAWDQHLEVSRPLTKKSRPGIVDEINPFKKKYKGPFWRKTMYLMAFGIAG